MLDEKELLDYCKRQTFGQTDYQNRSFVINAQLTPIRKLRQCVLEVNGRIEAFQDRDRSLRKLKWKMEEKQAEIDNENSIPKKEMMKIDFERFELERQKYQSQVNLAKKDLDEFVKIFKDIIEENDIDLETVDLYDSEEDRKYWLIRMAKNCAVDIACTGRISTANLNTILDMKENDYQEVLLLAHKYTKFISHEINRSSEIAMSSSQNDLLTNSNKKLLDFYEDDNI